MVNLRQVYLSDSNNHALGTLHMSTIRFATNMAGNLGAPLQVGNSMESTSTHEVFDLRRSHTSNNPLAVGLPQAEENAALLPEECVSPASFLHRIAYSNLMSYRVSWGPAAEEPDSDKDPAYKTSSGGPISNNINAADGNTAERQALIPDRENSDDSDDDTPHAHDSDNSSSPEMDMYP